MGILKMQFTIVSINMKLLGINLTDDVKDRFTEN